MFLKLTNYTLWGYGLQSPLNRVKSMRCVKTYWPHLVLEYCLDTDFDPRNHICNQYHYTRLLFGVFTVGIEMRREVCRQNGM